MNEIHIITTWLLYFYIYSFIGWIWECCFVSIHRRKWVNRGFIKGPLLPIYGSGAIIMLFVSSPFSDNIPLIYLSGMVGATILEYLTGAAMEALFKVRYWDYSSHKFNIHGYICLTSSLAWGLFTVLLSKYIHVKVVYWLSFIPPLVQNLSAIFVSIIFIYDFSMAFKNALQFRTLLEKVAAAKQDLLDMADKLENTLKENLTLAKGNFSTAKESLNAAKDNLTSFYGNLARRSTNAQEWQFHTPQTRKPENELGRLRQTFLRLSAFWESSSQEYKESNNVNAETFKNLFNRFSQWKQQFSRLSNAMTDRQKKLVRNHSHIVSKKYSEELEFFKLKTKHDSDKKRKQK